MDNDTLKFNENELLWGQLIMTNTLLQRARELELAGADMSLIQAMVLYALKISPEPMTPGKLAKILYREPHSMSALIGRMEKQGLVETKHDLVPKNLVRVVLTARGEEAFQRQRTANAVINLTSRLTKEERDTLSSCAGKLRVWAIELIRQMTPGPYD
jgi:DNA-binding MarR family transcriptional regulator